MKPKLYIDEPGDVWFPEYHDVIHTPHLTIYEQEGEGYLLLDYNGEPIIKPKQPIGFDLTPQEKSL